MKLLGSTKSKIHFGEDKAKSIHFGSKFKRKNIEKLHIIWGYTN